MSTIIDTLHIHKTQQNLQAFSLALDQVAPGLRNYIRQRLRSAERRGLLPPGLYEPDDVIDDLWLAVYQQFETLPQDESSLRVALFRMANRHLDDIIQQEAWHRRAVSLEDILKDEIRMMDEIPQITVDADGDILLVEELDDAEWEPPEPKILLLEESFEDELLKTLGVEPEPVKESVQQRTQLAHLYHQLPEQTRILLDLWTRGQLSPEEIAQVQGVTVAQVEAVLERVRVEFRRRLNQT